MLLAQVQARTHQIITDLKAVEQLVFDFDTNDFPNVEFNFRETYATALIVEAIASVDEIEIQDMEKLIAQGRYQFLYRNDGQGTLYLSRPSDLGPVTTEDGTNVAEYVIYNLAVPAYIKFR